MERRFAKMRIMKRQGTSFVFAVAVLLGAAGASAQDEDPRTARAQQLFHEGTEHYEDGRYSLAVEAFEASRALLEEIGNPRAGLMYFNIGASLEELPGREAETRAAYQRFLQWADPGDPELQGRIRQAQLRIQEADARERNAQEEGPAEPGGSTMSPVGPIVAATGGAMMLAGVVTGAVGLSMQSELQSACGEDRVCPETERGRVDDLRTMGIVTDVLLFGGLAVAGVGVALMFLLQEEESAGASAHLAPYCDSSACGLTAWGAF